MSLFSRMLKDMPSDEAQMRQAWHDALKDEGVPIANPSDYSPFWRLVSAMFISPALALRTMLLEQLLPQYFLRTATGEGVDEHAYSRQIERMPARPAEGVLVFARPAGLPAMTIPAGVLVHTADVGGVRYSAQTTDAVVFGDGATEATAPATATAPGAAHNLGAGFYRIFDQPIDDITVRNEADWLSVSGTDAESDDSLRQRTRVQFGRVGQYHSDAVYTSLIAQWTGLPVELMRYQHDAPRGPGSANVYVMADVGETPAALLQLINDQFAAGWRGQGDEIAAFAMPRLDVELVVSLSPSASLSASERESLAQLVEHDLRVIFRDRSGDESLPRTYPGQRLAMSLVASALHSRHPLLQGVEFSSGDMVPSGHQVPRLTHLTVHI